MSEWKIIWINPVSSSLIHRYYRSSRPTAALVSLWPLTFTFLPMILCRHSCSLCVTWFDLSGKHFFSATVWFSRFSSWLKFHSLWLKSVNTKWCFYPWKDQTYVRARLKHHWMRHIVSTSWIPHGHRPACFLVYGLLVREEPAVYFHPAVQIPRLPPVSTDAYKTKQV